MADETAAPEATSEASAAPAPEATTEAPASDKGRGPDGKFAKKEPTVDTADWRAGLDDDLRKTAEKFASPADALKSYREAEKRLSRALVRPGKDATDDDKAAWQAALRREMGIPEKVEDYRVDLAPELLADDAAKERVAAFLAEMHKEGAAPGAAARAINMALEWAKADEARMAQEVAEQLAEAEVALRREYGRDYDANMAIATAARAKFGDPQLDEVLKLSGNELAAALGNRRLGDVPALIKMMVRVGRDTGESRTVFQQTAEGHNLREQIDQLRASDAFKKGDKATNDRVNELYRQLYGDGAAAA